MCRRLELCLLVGALLPTAAALLNGAVSHLTAAAKNKQAYAQMSPLFKPIVPKSFADKVVGCPAGTANIYQHVFRDATTLPKLNTVFQRSSNSSLQIADELRHILASLNLLSFFQNHDIDNLVNQCSLLVHDTLCGTTTDFSAAKYQPGAANEITYANLFNVIATQVNFIYSDFTSFILPPKKAG